MQHDDGVQAAKTTSDYLLQELRNEEYRQEYVAGHLKAEHIEG